MKRFLTTFLIFSLLFFLADKLWYWKIMSLPKTEHDKRLEWILNGKMNRDILVFGSSRAQHDLYSDAIQDSLGMSAFNLGYRGGAIDFQLFLLKTVLKHNKKPKIIILTVDDYREFLPDKSLTFRYDQLYPLVKYQEITEELICRKEISPFAIGLYSARIGWQQFKKPQPPTKFENWTKAGTVLLDYTAIAGNSKMLTSKKYDVKSELPGRLADFAEFQEICKRENIHLYVLSPPNFQVRNKAFINRVKTLIKDKSTVFYSENETLFEDPLYFSDPSHLNKKGAIRYTNQIISRLKSAEHGINTNP